jgi:CheY-like chemotaxis protein
MSDPRPLKVLLVEDNLADANLVKEYIRETGIAAQIMVINDGQQAIALFQRINDNIEERPDLVLLDLNLPRRNGHEVLEFIRRHDGRIKVVIYSGSKSPDDVRRAKENKADGYLVKPMTVEEIDEVVKELRNALTSLMSSNSSMT